MNTQTMLKVRTYLAQRAIFVVLILLVIGIAIADPHFLGFSTLRDILQQSSTRLIIALGAAFILITGGVDLSAGRVVGLTAVISASMLQIESYTNRFFPDLPQLWVGTPIIVGIIAGLLVGLVNGLIIAKLHVPPFIATLGTMVGIYGVNSIYFDM
ncbi:beta-methylgalactoside transporter, partial [Paenibacillus sepulcri]|nr:beta-methylgalactoside transporter [Paenibacillus sepulcri]